MQKQVKQPIMSPESERFMAFSGVQQWALAVVDRRNELRRLQTFMQTFDPQAPRRGNIQSWIINLWQTQSAATDFCNAIVLLFDHVLWSDVFGDFASVITPDFRALNWGKIRDVRNMRVHVGEYFRGYGNNPDRWFEHLPEGSADASAIVNTSIGNRVDWEEIGGIVERMLEPMLSEPIPYPPPQFPLPPAPAPP